MAAAEGGADVPPRRVRKGRWLLIVGAVAIAVLLIVVGLSLLAVRKDAVSVPTIQLTSADDACRVDGQNLQGFNANEGDSVRETLTIHNANLSASCTMVSVTAETAGFSVSRANTPVSVPPDSNGTLSFSILAPSSPYSGSLTLDVE